MSSTALLTPASTDVDARDTVVKSPPRILVGTSPGILGMHDPRPLPLDTVVFLLRAELARTSRKAEGIFLAIDKRIGAESDAKDSGAIENRTDHLRTLVQKLTGYRFLTYTDVEESGRLREYMDKPSESIDGIEHDGLQQYTRLQTALVRGSLRHRDGENGTLSDTHDGGKVKFGWVLKGVSGNGKAPGGGEADFDKYLPPNDAIEAVYTAPGYTLDTVKPQAPYLVAQQPDRGGERARLCVPVQANKIQAELDKIGAGRVPLVQLLTISHLHDVLVAGKPLELMESNTITQAPVSKTFEQQVTAKADIDLCRAQLDDVLRRLLV